MMKRGEKKKTIFIRIIFMTAFVLIMWFAGRLLCLKTMHGSSQCAAMYAQPRDTIDVVMMGSSHMHCDVNPAILWEEYGIAAYDYSAAEQPMWLTYYYLKEFCKYQSPKVVVLDLYSPAKYGDSFDPAWIGENLYNIRFSFNKLKMISEACTAEQINSYFPSFFGYHWRYPDLEEDDLYIATHPDYYIDFKGFTPFYNVTASKGPALGVLDAKRMPERSEEYLNKIIEYTKDKGIELFLVVNPYPSTKEQEMVYNSIQDMARKKGISYRNFNYDGEEMGLDYTSDYNDESHLNYDGSCKFTSFLGRTLKDSFEIPDRRGDNRYSSWEENAKRKGVFLTNE